MKRIVVFLLAVLAAPVVCAQENQALLDAYVKNFDKGNEDAKFRLIEDASALNNPALAPLFRRAIDFAVSTSEFGKNKSLIRQFSVLSVEQCERYKHVEARTVIWKLFLMDDDSNVRLKTLKALGALAKGDMTIIGSLNNWLAAQISSYRTTGGRKPHLGIILRCVLTLGELGDESSFPVVFNVMHTGFSREVDDACRQVLIGMKGDFKPLLSNLIADGTIREKRDALQVALDSTRMSDGDKAEIAVLGLDKGLTVSGATAQDAKDLRDMRMRSTKALGIRRWSKATPLILRYFEETLPEYDKGVANKTELLEIIRALGSMGTHEAAQRLALYLNFLNIYTEKRKVYDEQIVTEVVDGLGRLGDKVAFDYLMNVKFLNYSARIKTNADEAIKSLKW
ncbi:MAG: hypothetical protein JXD23_07590 [Spirochaetales bacterium]|nr:hypothetical protein [Spirochaetales bacterium]